MISKFVVSFIDEFDNKPHSATGYVHGDNYEHAAQNLEDIFGENIVSMNITNFTRNNDDCFNHVAIETDIVDENLL